MASGTQQDLPAALADRLADFTGRVWVFDRLHAWLRAGTQRTFVLTGEPGSGKSTLVARLVLLSREEPIATTSQRLGRYDLAYAHFCQARTDSTLDPLRFVEALSLQLAARYQPFALALMRVSDQEIVIHATQTVGTAEHGAAITNVAIQELHIGDLSARRAFDRLVRRPLEQLCTPNFHETILILVDALDEALTYDPDENLVALLSHITADVPYQVRFLLTTRPDPRVLRLVGKPSLDLIADVSPEVDDVRQYAFRRLHALADPRRGEVADRIATAGKGNFLYARYMVDDLLPRLAQGEYVSSLPLPTDLEDIYLQFLRRELGHNLQRWEEHYSPVLGTLAVARGEGLTRMQIAGIIGQPLSRVDSILRACRQYVTGPEPDGPFRLYHESFRDFLLASTDYRVYPSEANQAITRFFLTTYQGRWHICQESYLWEHLATHLAAAGQHEELLHLLLDFAWLQAKLIAFGTQPLIGDFALALTLPGRSERAAGALAALRDMLVLAADLLRTHPEQLAQQLHARLGHSGDPLLEALLDAAHPPGSGWWLRPLRRSLPDSRGPLTATIRIGERPVQAVAATPDSSIIVAACEDMLEVWELATLERVRRIGPLSAPFSRGSRLYILADGDTLITVRRYEPITAYSIANGEPLWTLGGPRDGFAELSLSADEQRLVAGNSMRLVLWDLPTRKELWRIELPEPEGNKRPRIGRQFRGIGITADGERIVAGQSEGPIEVWNVQHRRFERELEGCPEEVVGFVAGTTPTRIIGFAVAAYSEVYVRHVVEWDAATGKILADRRFGKDVGFANALALIRPANRLASASNSGPIDLIDVEGSAAPIALLGHDQSALDLTLLANGAQALSSSQDGTLKLWDLGKALAHRPETNHVDYVVTASFGPDRLLCATASLDGSIIVWRCDGGTVQAERCSLGFGIKMLHPLPDSRRAFAVCYDKRSRIIDLYSYDAQVVDRTEYVERMLGSAASRDGRIAAVAWKIEDVSLEGVVFTFGVHVLDLAAGKLLQSYSSDDYEASLVGDSLAFRPGTDEVVSSADTQTCVWLWPTGEVLARHKTPRASAMVLAPDGQHAWLAIDSTIQALDLTSGDLVELARAEVSIESMAYCAATHQLVTASRQGTLSLWDTERWVALASYWGDAQMTACAIAPDGQRLAAGDAVGRVHLLEWAHRSAAGRAD